MSLIKLFESFDTDNRTAEEKDIYLSRKDAFRKLGSFVKKAALTTLPVAAFTAMPNMAFGRRRAAIDVLQFALLLERLEYNFYKMGMESGIIPASDTAVFTAIRDHELAHVELLETVISSAPFNGDPGTAPNFNFTVGGFDPFNNYAHFMAMSQAFEDTGVRAYKGQAANIVSNDMQLENNLLTTALKIHSVEARHAAQVRKMRGRKGWITTEDYDGIEGFNAATAPIYVREQDTEHLGVKVPTVATNVPLLAIEEAWDQPLTKEEVTAIIQPFLP